MSESSSNNGTNGAFYYSSPFYKIESKLDLLLQKIDAIDNKIDNVRDDIKTQYEKLETEIDHKINNAKSLILFCMGIGLIIILFSLRELHHGIQQSIYESHVEMREYISTSLRIYQESINAPDKAYWESIIREAFDDLDLDMMVYDQWQQKVSELEQEKAAPDREREREESLQQLVQHLFSLLCVCVWFFC